MKTYNWTFSPNEWVLLNSVEFNCFLEGIVFLLYCNEIIQHAFKIFGLQFRREIHRDIDITLFTILTIYCAVIYFFSICYLVLM